MNLRPYLTSLALATTIAACGPSKESTPEATLTVRYSVIDLQQMEDADSLAALCQSEETTLRAQLAELEASTAPPTIDGFYESYNSLVESLNNMASIANVISNVHPDESVRKSAEACIQSLSSVDTDIGLSRPLYDAIDDIEQSDADQVARFSIHKSLLNFKLSGVDKDDETRARIRELNDEITAIGQEFDRNIREDVRYLTLASADELSGLPQDYIDAHAADEDGDIRISTQYPDFIPFLKYAENDSAREKLLTIYFNRAYPDNKEILESLLAKRYELAQLIGYKNYAELITADKMVGSPEKVETFLTELTGYTEEGQKRDNAVLLARLQREVPDATELKRWQISYISEKVRQELYDVDSKVIREYFTYNQTRDGILNLVQDLFQVSIRPWETNTWHEDVEAYELYDGDTLLGRFYLDMHPREGKYQHAAMFPFVKGIEGRQTPVAGLICNFPPGDESMQHTQVVTFLHEFGHLIHFMFAGHQRWDNVSGISTEWDFVEAPSQMLQEWVWDYDTVSTFAKNKKGEVIPRDLLDRMTAARDFGLGMNTRRQLSYAALSMGLYDQNPEGLDIDAFSSGLSAEYTGMESMPGTHFYTSFGHLNGYSAIYYTYQWSLAIATDMFTQFEDNGLRNVEVAKAYRDNVLAAGGTKPAAKLVTDFLGREISFKPYADRLTGAGRDNPD
jgi:Zn-dependent oligopeptidase